MQSSKCPLTQPKHGYLKLLAACFAFKRSRAPVQSCLVKGVQFPPLTLPKKIGFEENRTVHFFAGSRVCKQGES